MRVFGIAVCVGAMFFALLVSLDVSAGEESKKTLEKTQVSAIPSAPHMVELWVSRSGYSLTKSGRAIEELQVPSGPIEIVLNYNEKIDPLTHQFVVFAANGFQAQSSVLSPSPDHKKATIEFTAEKNVKEYTIACNIECDPRVMGKLYIKIKVIG